MKRVKLRKNSLLTPAKLKRKAWEQFSFYVRHKEKGSCFTCISKGRPEDMHAGHFIHGRLDFDETNVHAQCPRCNIFLNGNLVEYTMKMIEKYGKDYVDELRMKAREIHPFNRVEIQAIYEKYKKLNAKYL